MAGARDFPVEEKIPEIKNALAANRSVVLTAPPGSGKTTCVPAALLNEPWLNGKRIIMLEPRRLAARACASWIAAKLGEEVGGTIGCHVRLERRVSSRTRLEIVTEGILSQRLLSDPELNDVGLIIFDEFHERSLQCDLSFALALEVRKALRDDMRIMVMSATLEAASVADHLGDAQSIHAQGRMYPVETKYLGNVSIPAAVSVALEETDGDILCFLPGEREIRRALESLEGKGDYEVLPLYGSLPKSEQDRIFKRSSRRRIVLATSIAETSLTVGGITAVIDSGLMRVPRFSPSTGMTGLVTLPLSSDRAEQRRGRAGRVGPGVCYRLWTQADEASRPAHSEPEILSADITSLVLASAAWGAARRTDLPWMTEPPSSQWESASSLLRLMGALDERGLTTEKGALMARLPMHPRLANMLLAASTSMCGLSRSPRETAAILAAIIEEDSARRESDIRLALDEIIQTPQRPQSKRILLLANRFVSSCRTQNYEDNSSSASLTEGALLAYAYPDRIAKKRSEGSFRMTSGKGAFVDQFDPLAKCEYIVCCKLDDRIGDARVFLGCPISPHEVEDIFSSSISEEKICQWDKINERVKCVTARRLGQLTISEKPYSGIDDDANISQKIAEAMVEGVKQKGVANMPCWTKHALELRARVNFISRVTIATANPWPEASDEAILEVLPSFIVAMTKWKDFERLDMCNLIGAIIAASGHSMHELDILAPGRLEMPSGSKITVNYDGSEPTVEVRLQECFGLMASPKIAGGEVPVVMTLLSPAFRPIQITKDLSGFWSGAYQLVRKDMRGRYPKHYWPEDPFTAVATRRTHGIANK